jgi:cytochrome b involved in lipid metabolism
MIRRSANLSPGGHFGTAGPTSATVRTDQSSPQLEYLQCRASSRHYDDSTVTSRGSLAFHTVMGWIAAGAGTLIATCLIYTLLTRHADGDSRKRSLEAVEKKQTQQKGEIVSNGTVTDHSTAASAATTRQSSHGNVPAPPSIVAPDETPVPSVTTPTAEVDIPAITIPSPPRQQISTNTNSMTMLPPPRPATAPRPPVPQFRNSSPPRLKPPTMAPPPRPSAAASLRIPVTRALSSSHMQPASSTLPLPTTQTSKKSRQITLAPGYSPLDWATLTKSRNAHSTLLGADFKRLSPSGALLKIPPSLLKQQTGRKGKDAWTSYKGRVYNVTPYLNFHPGGKAELLRAAGREGEVLFMEVHPWVNWEGMLGECCVGILVGEGEGSLQKEKEAAVNSGDRKEAGNELDEMD